MVLYNELVMQYALQIVLQQKCSFKLKICIYKMKIHLSQHLVIIWLFLGKCITEY